MTSLKGMETMFRQLSSGSLLFVFLFLPNFVKGQTASESSAKLVKQIVLHHSGPVAASDQLVKAHIRLKPGQPFNPKTTDEDITSLMGTNFFMNVRVRVEDARDGVIVHYTLIGLPTVMDNYPIPRILNPDTNNHKKISTHETSDILIGCLWIEWLAWF
jgi:hypothetical protein